MEVYAVMLYLIQLPCWPLLDLPHITTSHHDHHGRGESSALNFSEKRSRAGMGASVDGRDPECLPGAARVLSRQLRQPGLCRLNLFITISFVCCDSCKSGPGGGARPGMSGTTITAHLQTRKQWSEKRKNPPCLNH